MCQPVGVALLSHCEWSDGYAQPLPGARHQFHRPAPRCRPRRPGDFDAFSDDGKRLYLLQVDIQPPDGYRCLDLPSRGSQAEFELSHPATSSFLGSSLTLRPRASCLVAALSPDGAEALCIGDDGVYVIDTATLRNIRHLLAGWGALNSAPKPWGEEKTSRRRPIVLVQRRRNARSRDHRVLGCCKSFARGGRSVHELSSAEVK
jgi:hypothetical protein